MDEIVIECPILRSASILRDDKLPSMKEILQFYEYIRHDRKSSKKIEPKTSDPIDTLINDVKIVWQKINIPLISDIRMKKIVQGNYQKLLVLRRKAMTIPEPKSLQQDKTLFNKNMENLFDLSKCKCQSLNECSCRTKIIPKIFEFLEDQRKDRNYTFEDIESSECTSDSDNDQEPPCKKAHFEDSRYEEL